MVVTTACLALAACGSAGAAPTPAPTPEPTLEQRAGAAAQRISESIGLKSIDEPDAVLLLARASAQRVQAGHGSAKTDLRRQLNRLIRERVDAPSGGWGWGQGYAWDAFGDGIVNPADTMYSYTTAAAMLAFLDGYQILGQKRYLQAAERGATALLEDMCCWTEGPYLSVWYDDQPVDQVPERQVHNVNGLALAALARLDAALGAPAHAAERERMAAHLIAEQGVGYAQTSYGETPVSRATWKYSQASPGRPSDLLHETFIVEGLLDHGTEQAQQAAAASLEGMVASHLVEGRPREGRYTFGSLGWGPGAGLFILSRSTKHRADAAGLAEHVIASVDASGRSGLAERDELRAQAWYALGLARFANEPQDGI